MNERIRKPSAGCHNQTKTAKMANDIDPKKTMFVVVIVVGCFAVLWPKVFYPILVGSANQLIKPSAIDKKTGCCDVFSESDINTIKIMSELCSNIIQQSGEKSLTGKEIVYQCRAQILQTCGIDISAVLQEQVRLGKNVKQILNELRSLNGSLCLKYHFGVAPWLLGVPHRITVNFTSNIRQERPPHLKPNIIHPAFRERGSAITKSGDSSRPSAPKIVEGRPGPIPGMRPPMGGAGHVVPASQKGTSSMSIIMPVYTVGIVIFFTYTLMKLLFKKQPDGVGGSLYPPIEPDSRFRKEVFESERCKLTSRVTRDASGKIVVNAMSVLLDEVDEEFEVRRKINEVTQQANHNIANGGIVNDSVGVKSHDDQEQTSVKVLGMEMTASCEGGQKWSRPNEPVIPTPPLPEPQEPPQEIYLEGALPAQSQLLVADSATEAHSETINQVADSAVVLAGKMTLSVISMDPVQQTDNGEKSEQLNDIGNVEMNGDNLEEDELIEESKYTTASSATEAENDISEEEDEVEDEEMEDIEEIKDIEFDANHLTQASDSFEQ